MTYLHLGADRSLTTIATKKGEAAPARTAGTIRSAHPGVPSSSRARPGVLKKRIVRLNEQGVQPHVWSTWNSDFARLIAPVAPLIRGSALSQTDKNKLINHPLDFFFDIFDPIEDAVRLAVDEYRRQTGRQTVRFAGKTVVLRVDDPADNAYDASTKNLMRRLRAIATFGTLLCTDPIKFVPILASKGLDVASAIVSSGAQSAGQAAQDFIDDAGEAAEDIIDFLNPFNGLGATGVEESVAAISAAIGTYLAGEITVATTMTLLGAIATQLAAAAAATGVAVATGVATTLVTDAANGAGVPGAGAAGFYQPPTVVTVNSDGTESSSTGSARPGMKDVDDVRLDAALSSGPSTATLVVAGGLAFAGLAYFLTRPRKNPRKNPNRRSRRRSRR